ncbi:MAG: carboxypeptidase-like regulatory domain-containing protein, partial [bacterium]
MKAIRRIIPFLVLLLFAAAEAIAGNVEGTVTGGDNKLPLTGANVTVEGTRRGAATDLDGNFVIFNLAPGTYTLRFTMLGYQAMVKEGVVIGDKTMEVSVELPASAVELQEVTYVAHGEAGTQERELEERLEKSSITDAVSREVLRKLPDPDVANVVRRATGVSVEKGDPIIRGLGVRYSKVTLNNATVAGTEPNRSAVSLELFPANLMNQVTINKSFLPDQNGEFAGGTVNMNTFELPHSLNVSVSASSGYNSRTTFQPFQSYQGGGYDWLGFDDGTRAMPSAVAATKDKLVSAGLTGEYGYTPDQLKTYGKSFPNVWSPTEMTASPNQSYSLSIGNRANAFGFPMAYMMTGVYGHSYKYESGPRNVYKAGGAPGEVTDWHSYQFDTYQKAVRLGSMLALKFYPHELHNLNLNVLFSRDVTDEVRLLQGYNDDKGTNIRDTRLRFLAEQTLTTQLFGHHALPDVANSTVDWQMTWSRGTRDEPDTREQLYQQDPVQGIYYWAEESQSASHLFNNLVDNSRSGSVDWTFRPGIGPDNLKIKTGVAGQLRTRDSNYRRFRYLATSGFTQASDIEFLSQAPEVIFAPENIHPFGWEINEYTRPNDSYTASQTMIAGYMMVETNLHPRLFVAGGVRFEDSRQSADGYQPFVPLSDADQTSSTIQTTDLLPAITVKCLVANRMNLRLAASQTVSRPDFREMSAFEYTDFVGGYAVIGNPDLKRALIQNYDLRWEAVHGVADLAAVSVFYKNFENPIETVLQNTAQIRISYDNALAARNYGVEFEVRQNLGLISDHMRTFTMTSNLSLIQSEVDL